MEKNQCVIMKCMKLFTGDVKNLQYHYQIMFPTHRTTEKEKTRNCEYYILNDL